MQIKQCIAEYIRLSSEDNNVDGKLKAESISVTSQRKLISEFIAKQQEFMDVPVIEYVDATVIIGLKQNPTNGRRFSPIFLLYRAFCGAKHRMPL